MNEHDKDQKILEIIYSEEMVSRLIDEEIDSCFREYEEEEAHEDLYQKHMNLELKNMADNFTPDQIRIMRETITFHKGRITIQNAPIHHIIGDIHGTVDGEIKGNVTAGVCGKIGPRR